MSKQHKILIIVFCIGVLICGLGTGIAFIEFSHLTFGGKQIVGKTDMKTENIDIAFEPGDEPYRIWGQWEWSQREIQTDSRVPLNNVRFQITYNAERVKPYVRLNETEKEFRIVGLWTGGDISDLEIMMEAKDLILQNLKERKIVDLDTIGMEEVVVLINPENEEDVRLIY